MKTCIVALLLVCALALTTATPCGETACPFIYQPVCAQNDDASWTLFNNECEFNSCNAVTPFSVSCFQNVESAEFCTC